MPLTKFVFKKVWLTPLLILGQPNLKFNLILLEPTWTYSLLSLCGIKLFHNSLQSLWMSYKSKPNLLLFCTFFLNVTFLFKSSISAKTMKLRTCWTKNNNVDSFRLLQISVKHPFCIQVMRGTYSFSVRQELLERAAVPPTLLEAGYYYSGQVCVVVIRHNWVWRVLTISFRFQSV